MHHTEISVRTGAFCFVPVFSISVYDFLFKMFSQRVNFYHFLSVCMSFCLKKLTSDAESQYCCGEVGRVSQPLSTPNAPLNLLPNTDTYTKSFKNTHLPTFQLMLMYQWTNGWTDKASYGVVCPQLKMQASWFPRTDKNQPRQIFICPPLTR